MPDLCKLMTSTFILFRSHSLLYQTANFLNWRLFKMKSAGALLLCKRLGRLSHLVNESGSEGNSNIHFRKKRLLLVFSMATGCVFEHWKYNWIHHWSMYNWTYREGLKLLVGVWMNHLYIQHIKKKEEKKKLRELVNLSVSLYRHISSANLWNLVHKCG